MTKARQDATIRKIERNVKKLLPKPVDNDAALDRYEDEMGEDIRDLESEEEDPEGVARCAEGQCVRSLNLDLGPQSRLSVGDHILHLSSAVLCGPSLFSFIGQSFGPFCDGLHVSLSRCGLSL